MRVVLVVAVVSLFGCGGSSVSFDGAFVGTLTSSGPCSDGSSENASNTSTWNLTETGMTLNLSTNGACGLITGAISGDMATLTGKQCTAVTNGAATVIRQINSGTVTLTGNSLAVSISATDGIATNTASGTCNVTWSGTLVKQ